MRRHLIISARTAMTGLAFLLTLALTAPVFGQVDAGLERTALDDYVDAPDSNYKYTVVSDEQHDGYRFVVVDMISQKWLTEKEVNKPIWRHWVSLCIPDNVSSNKGFLNIGGSNNESNAPNDNAMMAYMAKATNTVTAEIRMVPNQPLVFVGETRPRSEDATIAYTWDKYMKTGDTKWPLRLPMTKAVVRAMDTITDLTGKGDGVAVDEFVVAGGSKRGWTTWTTAAVDNRVIAIAPIVIDMLNVVPSFEHHYQVYGRYAAAVGDYMREKIMERTDTPEYAALQEIVEPYSYRERLMLPKYIVNSAGDQFFLPDSWKFYWDDLIGEKWLRYVPNTDHGLGGSDAMQSVTAWYDSVVNNVPRPRFSWRVKEDGTIHVLTMDEPKEVLLWQAHNPEERNFMKKVVGEAWSSSPLKESGKGVYEVQLNAPKEGFTAYMVELTYESGVKDAPFKFTSGIKVVPDVLPHEGKVYKGRAAD